MDLPAGLMLVRWLDEGRADAALLVRLRTLEPALRVDLCEPIALPDERTFRTRRGCTAGVVVRACSPAHRRSETLAFDRSAKLDARLPVVFVAQLSPGALRCAMVVAPMRTRYDQFGKQMVRAALEAKGAVETDAEVAIDTRRIDLWFMPDPARGTVLDHLGVLGRIAGAPSTLEFFHNTPSGEDLAACLIKHGEFRHLLSLRRTPPPVPTQWVVSSGRPDGGIDGLWLRPITGWPLGIYEGPPLLWTRLVVVNELPVTRDTLLVRLLGAGAVLRQAIAELKALQAEAPERALALPILLRLRLTVPRDPAKQTTDDQEFVMDTQDIVETWRREAVQEGIHQGLAHSLVEVYEARFGTMPGDLRAAVDGVDDEPTLLGWLRLMSTRSADEIAAAILALTR